MADGYEVAKAYITIVPSMQGAQESISTELGAITGSAAQSAGESGGSALSSGLATGLKASAAVIASAVVAATAAAVASAKAFVSAAADVAAYGDEVDKTSQRLGVSRQAYQELDYVLNLAGTSMSATSQGFKTLANQIDSAINGSADAQAMFSQLGISLDDLSNMSTEEVFKAAITGFQGMEEGAERAALANDLFGRSGQSLAPLFNMTAEATQEAIDRANEYGMVMSDEGVAASAAYTDSLTTLKNTMTGLKNSLMSQMLPSLTKVTDGLAAIFAGDKSGIGMIKEGLSGIVSNINTLAPDLIDLASTIITAILDGFAPMIPDVCTALFSLLGEALMALTGLIPQLLPVIESGIEGIMQSVFDCLPLIIQGLLQLTTDLVTWLANGSNVQMLVSGIVKLVSLIVTSIGSVLPVLLPAIVQIIGEVAKELVKPENVGLILESIMYLIGAVAVALVEGCTEFIAVVVDSFNTTKDAINDFFNAAKPIIQTALNVIGQFFSNAWNSIKTTTTNVLNNIKSTITGWVNNIKSAFTTMITNVRSSVSTVVTNIQSFASQCISALSSLPSRVISIGTNIVRGIWNGISSSYTWIQNRIRGWVDDVVSFIQSALGIHSPSRVMADSVGRYMALGLGVGFSDTLADVQDDMTSSIDGLTANMSATVTANGTSGTAMLGDSTTYNGGSITVNVYGAEGQDVETLADAVAYRIEEMTNRKEVVYG